VTAFRKDILMEWTVADSRSLYGIRHWGAGYFNVGDNGNVWASPHRRIQRDIDLYELVGELAQKGLDLPLLVRFPDILQDRVTRLCDAFDQAIAAQAYRNH